MRIGFVLCEHPLDVRIKKEARSLASAGHEVFALLQHRATNQKVIDADAITVQTYQPFPSNGLLDALTFINRMSFRPVPIEPLVEKFAVEFDVDVLHVHDLPNVGTGIRVGRKLGIPVVADLHENHPAAVRAWVGRPNLRQLISTNRTIWESYQKRCVRMADKVITVIEEGRELLLGCGIEPDKVRVVANYVDVDYLAEYAGGVRPVQDYANRFVINYTGFLGPDRGIDVAIRAMSMVQPHVPSAHLVVVGDAPKGRDDLKALRTLAHKLDVQESVSLVGWQPFERVAGFVMSTDVGLVPHQRNPHRDNTIPNKLFDYMGFGKPVIVSDCPPLARIVRDADAGMVFKANRPEELAESIVRLYRERELADRLGANGKAAVRSRYNWDTASAELVGIYDELSTAAP